jgi:outer membrane immunogenic protein
MKSNISVGLALSLSIFSLWSGTTGKIETDFDWSGFYFGGNVGAISSKFLGTVTANAFIVDLLNFPASIQTYNASNNSISGGGQVGYNWKINSLILGSELNITVMRLNNLRTLTAQEAQSTLLFTAGDSFRSHINWQSAWVTRLGVGVKNWLLYALGGATFSEATVSYNVNTTNFFGYLSPNGSASSSKLLFGGTVGAGAEYALTKHIHVGIEYRFSDYASRNYTPGNIPADYDLLDRLIYTNIISTMSLSTNQVLAKINYQF